MPTLEKIRKTTNAFADKTFGKKRSYTSSLHHLKREVDELIESGDILEFADCMLLLLDSFNKKYPKKHTSWLLENCAKKIEINKKRKWGKPDKNGMTSHIKPKPKKYYLNKCANGGLYVSKKPMDDNFYYTPTILYCVPTESKEITKKGVFVGAVCVTIKDEILEIVKIEERERVGGNYIDKKINEV